jgi:thiol-disulfide isomerase/thioredoxin
MKFFSFTIILILACSTGVFSQKGTGATIELEGQIVCCAECWAEADRTKVEFGTAEDLLKAKSCVEGGDPTLIAVRNGDKFNLYKLEQGQFKLTEKNWLNYVGKSVAVTGTIKKKTFVVDTLKVVKDSLAERERKAAIGQEIPLKLKDLFGTDQSLSQFKGRIVILNFWATFCLPCREEMPDLAKIQNEYAALGVQVIGASTDEISDRPKVLKFIRETKVNFPIWMGATTVDMSRFGLGGALPGTVVIDKTGKIIKVISGIVKVEDLRKQIDGMLEMAESNVETVEPKEPVTSARNVEKKSKVSSVPS